MRSSRLAIRILLIDTQWPESLSPQRALPVRGTQHGASDVPVRSWRRLALGIFLKMGRNACALIVCAGLAWGADNPAGESAAPGPPAKRKFGEIIGLQVKFAQGSRSRHAASLEDSVSTGSALSAGQSSSPRPDSTGIPGLIQARLAYYKQHGYPVLLLAIRNRIAYSPTQTAMSR
jgi:hypothetical protein